MTEKKTTTWVEDSNVEIRRVGETFYRDGFKATVAAVHSPGVYEVTWEAIVTKPRQSRGRSRRRYSPRGGGRSVSSIVAEDTMRAVNEAYERE